MNQNTGFFDQLYDEAEDVIDEGQETVDNTLIDPSQELVEEGEEAIDEVKENIANTQNFFDQLYGEAQETVDDVVEGGEDTADNIVDEGQEAVDNVPELAKLMFGLPGQLLADPKEANQEVEQILESLGINVFQLRIIIGLVILILILALVVYIE